MISMNKFNKLRGTWVAQLVKPPWAKVMISGSWDQALRWAPHSVGSLLEILSLSLCPNPCLLLSLSLKWINKYFKKKGDEKNKLLADTYYLLYALKCIV